MTVPTNGAVTINDSLAFKEQLFNNLVQSARVHAPLLKNHMKAVSEMGSKLVWYQQALSQERVTLAAQYTLGDATMTISAPTTVNPFKIFPGISQVMTKNGDKIWNVTSVNATTTLIGVSLDQGTDANVANGTELFLIKNDDIGADFGAHNNVSFSSTDINYVSNMSDTIRIANPIQDGRFMDVGFNEGAFEHQVKNNLPEVFLNMEYRIAKDVRVQGSNASTSNGFTRTAGTGSRAGGIVSFIQSGSGYNPTTAAAISEDLLETDMINLRDRGAFTTTSATTRNNGISTVKAYISENTLADVNKLIRLERAPEIFLDKKTGGVAGTFATKYLVNGVIVDFEVSDAMQDSEILYLPRPEDIEVPVLRLYEKEDELGNGDNTQRMYATTWSVKAQRPWLMGFRENLTRP